MWFTEIFFLILGYLFKEIIDEIGLLIIASLRAIRGKLMLWATSKRYLMSDKQIAIRHTKLEKEDQRGLPDENRFNVKTNNIKSNQDNG